MKATVPEPALPNVPWRVAILQRVLPAYRAPFFELLAGACVGGLYVAAGEPQPQEGLGEAAVLKAANYSPLNNRYYGSGRWLVFRQQNLVKWLEACQPDILITDTNPRGLSTPSAVRWMRARRRPVIGWGLGVGKSFPLLSGLSRGRLSQYDAVISYSQSGARVYAEAGVDARRIFIAPNAVTPKPEAPAPLRPSSFMDRPTVLFVGRLQTRKRLEVLMRACAALPTRVQPHLHIVGDGDIRGELERQAGELYPDTQFWGDLRGEALHARFHAADLFVLPGTGGLALQHAMRFALPVIAAEADGTQNDLVRAENGRIVTPGDVEALCGAMLDLLSDVARLRGMGLESYRIARDEINLERMVEVFASAMRAVMEE